MRPLLLEVEGLTSFREKVTLDFADLDLFAITGPTGAGKSSLVDALIWALFGQVPRVGKEYRQLLSHDAERLTARLDFAVGQERYRVVRTLSGGGRLAVRLERLRAGEVEPLADRAADVAAALERLIGLDYGGFVRTVVLPQGQFDQFLKGDAAERRSVLVSLLDLRVYERMAALTRARAVDARREADYIAQQLTRDFAAATPEALATLGGERERLAAEAELLAAELRLLGETVAEARVLREAERDLQRLTREAEDRRSDEDAARTLVDSANAERDRAERALSETGAALVAAPDDGARLLLLAAAKPRAEQLVALAADRQRREESLAQETRRLAALEAGCDGARRTLDSREVRARDVEAHWRRALEAREQLRLRHAAHVLRRGLVNGRPCPVCEQTVTAIPPVDAPDPEGAESTLAAAEAEREAARTARETSRLDLTRLTAEQADAQASVTRTRQQLDEATRASAGIVRELAPLGYEPQWLADGARLLRRLSQETADVLEARSQRERLASEARRLESERTRCQSAALAAAAQLETSARRRTEVEAQREAAQRETERLDGALRARCLAAPLALSPPAAEQTWLALLDGHLSARQRRMTEVAADLARVTTRIEGLNEALERATELRRRQQELQSRADVANTLARALQADQFLAFVQDEALRRLAEDGSERLMKLSLGRYGLLFRNEEFLVVDHWSADTERSVKTLSGGEIFLASLALALALAERLAELSAAGHAQETLESLFLDEGFGGLDAETLDVVVSALEALQGGRRMVGVITHIEALAERLPARVTVTKTPQGARLRLG